MSHDPKTSASPQPRSAAFVELRNTLPSDLGIISPFVDRTMQFMYRFQGEQGNVEIELALREALANAIVHGNHEDPVKRVYVQCRFSKDGEVSITVEDEGSGFDYDEIADLTSPDNRLRTHGRGILLIRTLMDEVYFDQGGAVVHMCKRANAGSGTVRKPQ
jgi:serine/threonine-protein kinase RsbW